MIANNRVLTRDHRVDVAEMEQVHLVEILNADDDKPKPAILILHGTTGAAHGTRRWRLRLGRHLAKHGYCSYLFDSRGHGYSDGEFEDSTVSKYIVDAAAVLSWIRSQPQVAPARIGLFGFSLGSAISVLLAQKHPDWIKTLLVYTIPCDMHIGYLWYFERFAQRSLDKIYSSPEGKAWINEFGNYFTKAFLDDLPRHDVKKAIAQLAMPLLLIQPDNDDQVPRWVSDQAYSLKPEPKDRLDIRGTHTLVKQEKKDGWDFDQERLVTQECLQWFNKTL